MAPARGTTTAQTRSAHGLLVQPDDADLGDGGVLLEDRLDLDAIDVLAAPDDHVLDPVDHVHEPLAVDETDIARAEPPGLKRGFRGGGVVPVAVDHLRRPDAELASLTGAKRFAPGADDADVSGEVWKPDTVGVRRVLRPDVHHDGRRRLRRAVPVEDRDVVAEDLDCPGGKVGRNRCAPHRDHPDIEAELAHAGMLEDLTGDRWYAPEARDLFLARRGEGPPRGPTCASSRSWCRRSGYR